jgi:hypothetical protein
MENPAAKTLESEPVRSASNMLSLSIAGTYYPTASIGWQPSASRRPDEDRDLPSSGRSHGEGPGETN